MCVVGCFWLFWFVLVFLVDVFEVLSVVFGLSLEWLVWGGMLDSS